MIEILTRESLSRVVGSFELKQNKVNEIGKNNVSGTKYPSE